MLNQIVGGSEINEVFQKRLELLEKGNGSVVLLGGYDGTGKSHFIEHITNQLNDKRPDLPYSAISAGGTGDGVSQPLSDALAIVEKLLVFKSGRAKKRFSYNLGITMLTAIPLVGDVFYAAKEIGRDWEKYKKEQSQEQQFSNSQIEDLYAALVQMSNKQKIAIFIDNLHKVDNASLEVFSELINNIENETANILFFATYSIDAAKEFGSPFSNLITSVESKTSTSYSIKTLSNFSIREMKEWLSQNLEDYRQNDLFTEWLYSRTQGNQGTLSEYLRYFRKNPPINENGIFRKDFYEKYLPSSVYEAVKDLGKELSSHDMDMLCTAAAEGAEFTAYMLSQLTSKSSLATVRELRRIEHDYGLIKSNGTGIRYGEKTTKYVFTQAYYSSYFESQLLFEEKRELHQRIAETLKKRYEQTEDPYEKSLLIGQIAKHSLDADDDETAAEYLSKSITELEDDSYLSVLNTLAPSGSDLREKVDNLLVRKQVFESDNQNESNFQRTELDESQTSVPMDIGLPFENLRLRVALLHNEQLFTEAFSQLKGHIKFGRNYYSADELSTLYLMQAKTLIELEEYDAALVQLEKAEALINISGDRTLECVLMNLSGILKHKTDDTESAIEYLRKASELALQMEPENQIMTLYNLSSVLKSKDLSLSEEFRVTAQNIENEMKLVEAL
ncbi:MAG: hypothetical protein Kapaf2KO_16890 [Candidatus Kapaibacteriales bacterium]